MAKLYFRHSPMNAGKTTSLLQVAHNYGRNGELVLLIKPDIDTKGDDRVVSRLGIERQVDILAGPDLNVRTAVHEKVDDQILRCALVDEAQFLQPTQVDQLRELVTLDGIVVITYGLRTDFQTNLFPGSKRLLELADEIEELKTMCRCMENGKAIFNARFVNGKMVFEGDQVAIDGEDEVTYEPLCSKCYLMEKQNAGHHATI